MKRSVTQIIPFGLTLVAAGLGHLYLRHWRRGLLWLGLYLFSLTFLSTYSIVGDFGGPPFLVSIFDRGLSLAEVIFPLLILLACVIDVYVFSNFDVADTPDSVSS
ncbi:MAG: hypothetical protein J07HR59_01077 [Halorubrum sp. J07HR59]|jgi:hypothetical protein|nr:MAG: hypothetical protein J07HR59_01077 [Halorubrum sp. J07HR59]